MSTLGSVSSAQLSKKTDTEEFVLVILDGGTGSTIAAWTFASERPGRGIDRPQIYWRIVPEHRLHAQQEHHSQR